MRRARLLLQEEDAHLGVPEEKRGEGDRLHDGVVPPEARVASRFLFAEPVHREVLLDEPPDLSRAEVVRACSEVLRGFARRLSRGAALLHVPGEAERHAQEQPGIPLEDRGQWSLYMLLQQAVAGGEDVEADTPGAEHPLDFCEQLVVVLDVLQDILAEDEIERAVFERKGIWLQGDASQPS